MLVSFFILDQKSLFFTVYNSRVLSYGLRDVQALKTRDSEQNNILSKTEMNKLI